MAVLLPQHYMARKAEQIQELGLWDLNCFVLICKVGQLGREGV